MTEPQKVDTAAMRREMQRRRDNHAIIPRGLASPSEVIALCDAYDEQATTISDLQAEQGEYDHERDRMIKRIADLQGSLEKMERERDELRAAIEEVRDYGGAWTLVQMDSWRLHADSLLGRSRLSESER